MRATRFRSGLMSGALLLAACSPTGGGAPIAATPTPSPAPAPAPAPTPAPTPTPSPSPSFAAIQAAIDRSPVANVYVAIGTRAGTLFRYRKGNFASDAVTPIASASKFLAGVTIMRLVERGVMRLGDNPQRFLSYWTSDPADPRSRVTLQQLLSFTSGFNAEETDQGCIRDATTTIAACAQSYYARGLGSAPGTAFSYGPAHLQIAAAMAEAATGKPWAQLFREEVGAVAGLSAQTLFTLPSNTNPRVAGGGVSTVDDYARFLDALLANRLLSDIPTYIADRTAGLAVLNTPDVTIANGEWHYALAAWRECDDRPFSARCASQRLVSSPGAFGWTPWIDYDRGYWGLIAMNEGVNGSIESVRLEQELQPLINAYLGQP
ncbi:MAG: beta-lactamase family protein [Sphingomonas sp.]|nr:beta-lactamase family protein [Sphingomonas sp.]